MRVSLSKEEIDLAENIIIQLYSEETPIGSTIATTPAIYNYIVHRTRNMLRPRGNIVSVQTPVFETKKSTDTREYTGLSVNYYKVSVTNPTSGGDPYTAECNDIIEALGMNYAEGNAFKAIWRSCAARHLGLSKRGYDDAKYDAEKVVFFAKRMVEQATPKQEDSMKK